MASETKPNDLATLLPGFSIRELRTLLLDAPAKGISRTEAVVAYLEPLVRALAEAKDAAHSRGDEARYHMVTAINDHAELTKLYAAERAARQLTEDIAAERQAALRQAVAAAWKCAETYHTNSINAHHRGHTLETCPICQVYVAALAAPSAARAKAEAEVLQTFSRWRDDKTVPIAIVVAAHDRLRAVEAGEKGSEP